MNTWTWSRSLNKIEKPKYCTSLLDRNVRLSIPWETCRFCGISSESYFLLRYLCLCLCLCLSVYLCPASLPVVAMKVTDTEWLIYVKHYAIGGQLVKFKLHGLNCTLAMPLRILLMITIALYSAVLKYCSWVRILNSGPNGEIYNFWREWWNRWQSWESVLLVDYKIDECNLICEIGIVTCYKHIYFYIFLSEIFVSWYAVSRGISYIQ